ncbi:CGP-CTERM sorting domain-containing protein [Palaeococcus ferrophilus]|uniref:CGP-CTERM sorting domain-containing protein n=1 Tax=Palaeococcus ferrophilus TaxID=83868 RepID=UPI000698257D|nr:CGP-CTERM sorting domain-containing protein [Palaeococcus ferrophilus]
MKTPIFSRDRRSKAWRKKIRKSIIGVVIILFLSLTIIQVHAQSDAGVKIEWEKTFGGNGEDFAYSIQQTSDGGYIIAGATNSFGAGYYDVYLVKIDSAGNLQWEKTFGGEGMEGKHDSIIKPMVDVRQTTDGGYVVVSYTYSFDANYKDVYLVKTDPNGNLQWQRTFDAGGFEEGHSIQQTTDGGYVIAGFTDSFGSGDDDVYVIKLSPGGQGGTTSTVQTQTSSSPQTETSTNFPTSSPSTTQTGPYPSPSRTTSTSESSKGVTFSVTCGPGLIALFPLLPLFWRRRRK